MMDKLSDTAAASRAGTNADQPTPLIHERSELEGRITHAVFAAMRTTDITRISVASVVAAAGTSRSTFYRYYESVEDVVRRFELDLLDTMRAINRLALKADHHEISTGVSQSIIARMEVLQSQRDYIVALNSCHGDPQFVYKATVLMTDYFREKLKGRASFTRNADLYAAFIVAGHNRLIEYWLEHRPDISPEEIGAMLNKLFYAVIASDELH